jgi:hypothetical protein
MPLIQKNGGTVGNNASIVTSLPSGTTAGNTILIFAQGTGTISTPSGFTSRSPQVALQGFYLFEKLVATGNASDTPTLTMSGAYTATWNIVEYSNITGFDTSSGNNSASASNGVHNTPSITPASGNKRLMAGIAGWSAATGPITWTSGDPQGWTNSFTGQQSFNTPGAASPANQSPLASGFADRLVKTVGASYSTAAMVSNVPNSRAPTSIIAAYTTSDVPADIEPQFRERTVTGYASRTNTVILPPSIFNGDILILTLFMGLSGTVPTPTLPSGFTLIDSTTASQGGFNGVFRVAWKRAASESGSYTITHTVCSTEGTISVYSDCIGTGSPINVYSKATGTGATATATSITTTVPLTKLLFHAHNWVASSALTPPTGFTERLDSIIYTADKTQTSAGASGAVSNGTGNATAEPWSAFLLALKGAATTAPGRAKVWSGSAWVQKPVKVWNGTSWVTKPLKIWNGTAWV